MQIFAHCVSFASEAMAAGLIDRAFQPLWSETSDLLRRLSRIEIPARPS